MIRRLFIAAVSLAALTACTTYNSGYRNYSPAQAGYGDYYYAPDPAPSYYSPGYLHYPAYYSLYWGFDRHYYSSWRQPHFHYGVTWFPNDWFAFSVVHRYPRYSYWHPYAPYRYSAWDHRFAWHHYSPPRHYHNHYHYYAAPRYGHPSNERHMQRERLVGGPSFAPRSDGPRGRNALEAAAAQRQGSAPQRAAYRPQSTMSTAGGGTTQAPTAQARMRQQAVQAREARLRDDEVARARSMAAPAEARQVQRPWQQDQPAPRARASAMPDAALPRTIPERGDSRDPRQVMGNARGAPMRQQVTGDRMQEPRIGDAPRARAVAPAPVQQQRMPARQAPQVRDDVRHAPRAPMTAPAAPQRHAMPTAPQPRMQPSAPAPARQAPARQAVPARAAPTPATVHQSAPPAPQAAPPTRRATTRSTGRARSSIEQEP